jgi:hypothetical protein
MRYYVYKHVDPLYGMTVYVGKGCGGRAWDVTRNRNGNKEHLEWMLELCELGYSPDEWVVIIQRDLDEETALRIESEYRHTNGCPIYNRQSGEKNYQAKLTDKQAREIFQRAKAGEKHGDLSEEFGVSRSAVSMIASRKQWRAATACLI